MKRCYNCMTEFNDEFEVCPYCGYIHNDNVENALHMFPGTVLDDKYILGRVIGYGGFGVTYLAWDTVLRTKVAIKEYLPSEFSTRAAGETQVTVFSGDKSKQFADGMVKFVDEAKRLAKFRKENGIVKIFDCFNQNGTAYIVMEYLQGETLAKRLEREKTIPIDEATELLMPIIESLNKVHDEGIIHRDIAPDNIFLTDKGEVKLIDFGASRYATTSKSRSLTVIIKPGYSAEEQYRSRSDQDAHTDVYSVGAVLYRMITGQAPPDAMERRALFEKTGKDMLIPIKKFGINIDRNKENAIYNALNIRISDRTPDMISLAGELTSEEPVSRKRSNIKKIDILTWPLWAKIGIPTGIVSIIALCVLFAFGIIGPKSKLATDFIVPEGQVLVPNIVAESYEDAHKTLSKENLTPRIADKVPSVIIDRDLVLRQNPDALNVVNKGSVIDIIISEGKGMNLIPDVVGLTVEFATQKLKEAGFEVATVEESSETVASGAVISQDFEPEAVVEKGTTVTLTVSTGSASVDRTKLVIVPDIVGMDYDQARKELSKYKLGAAIDGKIYNNDIPDNQVVSQTPGKNIQAHQGDTIYVTVNEKRKMVSVIDYKGRSFREVEKELLAADLVVEANYVQNKEFAPGTICSQNIANKSVPAGTKIIFTVSEGYTVKVPDVSGKTQRQAEDILIESGLAVETVTEYSSTVGKGKVIRHNLAGEEVELGTTITLVISSDNENATARDIVLTSIYISSRPSQTEYYVGDSFNSSGISVEARYSDSSGKNITSQCKIPSVRFDSAGSETITVSYEEGGITKTASLDVRVNEPSIELLSSNVKINEGTSYDIGYNTYPSGISVNWKSDNTGIATVSNGNVTGVSEGRATITATMSYGGKQYQKSVMVNVSRETINFDSNLSISLSSANVTVNKGAQKKISASYEPYTDGIVVKWNSSNSNIAKVIGDGSSVGNLNAVITGVEQGTATITASITYNGKTYTSGKCTVNVEKAVVERIEVDSSNVSTNQYIGDDFNAKGLRLNVYYSGVSTPELITDNFSIKQNNKTTEVQNITVHYGGKSKTFSFTFKTPSFKAYINDFDIDANNTNDSIQIKTSGTPSNGWEFEYKSLSPDSIEVKSGGLIVTNANAVTSNNASVEVIGTYKDSYTQTVKITGIVVKKAVTVESAEIVVSNEARNKQYRYGDEISKDGIWVSVVYSDGKTDSYKAGSDLSVKLSNGGTKVVPSVVDKGDIEIKVEYKNIASDTFYPPVLTPTLTFSNSSITLKNGESKKVSLSVGDISATDYEIKWDYSGPVSLSERSNTGVEVTATGTGSATVTAKLYYCGEMLASKSFNVTVESSADTAIPDFYLEEMPSSENFDDYYADYL